MLTLRSFLWANLLAIALYVITVIVLGWLTPQYSHIANVVSDLGRLEAPYHQAFSLLLGTVGALFVLSSLGFFAVVKTVSGHRFLSVAIAMAVAAIGIGFMTSAIFPLPDPRHGGFGLARLIFLMPVLISIAVWKKPVFLKLTIFNGVAFVGLLASIPIFRWLIEQGQMGLGQRITVLIMFGWFSVTSYTFLNTPDAPESLAKSAVEDSC
ncbi:MAG: DUF998 domain-containing protein [Cyanobacteria bacterium P01_A01_bin.123]